LTEIMRAAPSAARALRRGDPVDFDDTVDNSYSQNSYNQDSEGEEGEVQPGMRVRHPVFGVGMIVTVSGQGLNQKLKIRFDRAGVKTVMVRYANLELA
jgi:DNA helicase-2/ATP-dependent DNA helicase PcrA